MGREWYLNWGTKSSTKKGRAGGGGAGGRGSCNGSESRKGERKSSMPPTATAAAAAAATAGGCMNAVLHLFDLQHFQLCLHPQDNSVLPDDFTPLKGLEAPRNSLESITKEEKDDPLPISIKTNRRDAALRVVQAPRGKMEDLTSESSCSPASARTPNVVARLMGLEILPESNNTTPRSSSSHSQPISSPHVTSTSSTPPVKTKTPVSRSTRRRSTDVVDHHRLSLQINKENSIQKQMELSRPSCSAINTKKTDGRNNVVEEEVSKSPSYYARQIMKQAREAVSRRVGVDITNTISNGARSADHRRDEHLLSSPSTKTTTTKTSKHKKSSKKDHSLSHLSSSSPRLRSCINDENSNSNSNNSNKCMIMSTKSDQLRPLSVVTELPQKAVTSVSEDESLKRFPTTVTPTTATTTATDSSSNKERLMSKKPLKSYESIRNKKDEQFVRPSATATTCKKSKKTTLSSDLLHGTVPSLVPFKKDSSTSSPSKLFNKQGISSNAQLSRPITTSTDVSSTTTTAAQLPCYPRQRINEQRQEEAIHAPGDRCSRIRKDATIVNTAMEFQYISRILKCTGIDRDTPVSFMRWFLPSHPLDPSIFHNLEAEHYLTTTTTTSDSSCKQLNLAVNRKLIFHLVDEMLAEMLKPYVNQHYHHHHHHRRRRRRRHHLHEQDQQINGFQLVKILCTRIRSFPTSDCQTLQDIDALVEKDLPSFGAANNLITYQEEGEEIVSEIESHIMDSLIQEITGLD